MLAAWTSDAKTVQFGCIPYFDQSPCCWGSRVASLPIGLSKSAFFRQRCIRFS